MDTNTITTPTTDRWTKPGSLTRGERLANGATVATVELDSPDFGMVTITTMGGDTFQIEDTSHVYLSHFCECGCRASTRCTCAFECIAPTHTADLGDAA